MRSLCILSLLILPIAGQAAETKKPAEPVLLKIGGKDVEDKNHCIADSGKVVIVNGIAYCRLVIDHNSGRSNITE